MVFKDYRLFAGLRTRYSSNFTNPRSVSSYPWVLQKRWWTKQSLKSTWWPIGKPQQHFGPKAHIPDLFQRKDDVRLKLAAQQLEWYGTPPRLHHDLLGAVANVGRLEGLIKYTFKNKMTCVEALKVTSSVTPLFFKGIIQKVDRNNRLALLGDRVLRLILCEIWFSTGNSSADYMTMHTQIESRVSLAEKARALGMHKELLLPEGVHNPKTFQIAEAFEAVIGAIYLDSGKNIGVVKKVITDIKLDDNEFLRPNPGSRSAQNKRERLYHHAEGKLLSKKTEFLKRQTLLLQKEMQHSENLVLEQQGDNPVIDPDMQVTAKTTALHSAPEDGNTSIRELRDNFSIDSQIEVHCKKHIEYLHSLSGRQKNEKRREYRLAIGLQTQADSKKNAVNELQPVENMSADPANSGIPKIAKKKQDLPVSITKGHISTEAAKESAVSIVTASTSVEVDPEDALPPEPNSAAISDLIKKIKVFHRRKSGSTSKRARKRWVVEYKILQNEAWHAAVKKAAGSRDQHLRADKGVLYEEMLQERLDAVLKREQHFKREREVSNTHNHNSLPGDPQETPETEVAAIRNSLGNHEFDSRLPDEPSTEGDTYTWTPPNYKKTMDHDEKVDPTQNRLPRRHRKSLHRTGKEPQY